MLTAFVPFARLRAPRTLIHLTAGQAIVLMVGLGVILRLVLFLRIPSVWHDEAALLINVVRLHCAQMFGPLLEHVGAPPLFLCAERGMLHLFGDGIASLRLLPFLASCGSLIVMAHLSWQILPRAAAVWAVALFVLSDRLLWHNVEAKPYAVDVLVAALLIEFFLFTRHLPLRKQVLAAAPIMPVIIWFSYPSCFFVGAWFFVQLPALCRSRSIRDWLVCVGLAAAVLTSFAVLTLGPIHAQRDDYLNNDWVNTFPNWQQPWTLPIWVVENTVGVFSYCIGPCGWMLTVTIALGGLYLWRTGERALLAMLAIPVALACFAGLIGKYPYGDFRVCVYLAPVVYLLLAAGIPGSVDWLRRRSSWAVVAFWVVLAVPLSYGAFHVIVPPTRADNTAASEYVLANWQPGDAVYFTQWEGQYYFRNQIGSWVGRSTPDTVPAKRVWCFAIGRTLPEREAVLKSVSPGRFVIEQREFLYVTVSLLECEKSQDADSTTAGPGIP